MKALVDFLLALLLGIVIGQSQMFADLKTKSIKAPKIYKAELSICKY